MNMRSGAGIQSTAFLWITNEIAEDWDLTAAFL